MEEKNSQQPDRELNGIFARAGQDEAKDKIYLLLNKLNMKKAALTKTVAMPGFVP